INPSKSVKYIKVFQVCDKDNKGYLVREVLKGTAVMFFGYKHLKVYTFFHICFEDPAYVDVSLVFIFYILLHLLFENFFNLMSAKKTSQLPSFFEFEDFKRAFSSISPKLPEKIIVEAFREIDQDSDGCISFKEFESAMKCGQNVVSPVYFA
uniref:EF-hand calcium binding domain 11 n=1 Tax=Amazona collaria TaxID=241587 RepID=A0A8B9G8B7_9PSIT